MATVRPHLAPRGTPLPPPPSLPPPPAAAAALPRSPYARCRAPDAADGRKESVAESCCPTEAAGTVIDDDVDVGSDDDGCGSCVDGSEGSAGQGEEASDVDVWWSQQGSSSRCSLWPQNARRTLTNYRHVGDETDDDDDPKASAARRQEEDRKFWEACLSSGNP